MESDCLETTHSYTFINPNHPYRLKVTGVNTEKFLFSILDSGGDHLATVSLSKEHVGLLGQILIGEIGDLYK